MRASTATQAQEQGFTTVGLFFDKKVKRVLSILRNSGIDTDKNFKVAAASNWKTNVWASNDEMDKKFWCTYYTTKR